MRLGALLLAAGVDASVPDVEISGISIDSRVVSPGDLFIAVPGEKVDGHDFVAKAVGAGAAAVIVERKVDGISVPQMAVPSASAALSAVATAFHGDPSNDLVVIGVTGTNGKTTVTWLLESIVTAAGFVPAVAGTVNYRIAGREVSVGLTTPLPHDLQRLMRTAKDAGATHFLMEVSSHSLQQGRVDGVRFDAAVFTNLSRDHLDYHGTMDAYFDAKARLFKGLLPASGKKNAVAAINGDDPFGTRILAEVPGTVSFGFAADRDVRPTSMASSLDGTVLELATPWGGLSLSTPLCGGYNVANVMAAVSVSLALGIAPDAVREGVARAATVPGRMERVPDPKGGRFVYVDYAHTPDGLDRVLTALREVAVGRLITVFGCGGDRDRGKRPLMGRVAASRSEIVVLTSDNPRTEDPVAILAEIEPGVLAEGLVRVDGGEAWEEGFYIVEPDRHAAISRAISLARAGDTVVIAGKGHENVQIVGDRGLPFSDRETARTLLGWDR